MQGPTDETGVTGGCVALEDLPHHKWLKQNV
jgi:hypothetical protein